MLDNKTIFRKIAPFLAVFIVSLSFAFTTFIHQATSPTQAEDDDIHIDLINIQAPTVTNATWQWNAVVFIKDYFKNPVSATYTVHWCGGSSGRTGETVNSAACDPTGYQSDYKIEPGSGQIQIQAKNSISKIEHQSIDCGRVEVIVEGLGRRLGKQIYDTGIVCEDSKINSFGSSIYNASGESAPGMLQDLLNLIGDPDIEVDIDLEELGKDTGDPSDPGDIFKTPDTTLIAPVSDANAQHAVDLANYILQNCAGRVNFVSVQVCMDKFAINSKNDRQAKIDIIANIAGVFSQHGITSLQCVGFVKAAYAASTGSAYTTTGDANSRARDHEDFTFHDKNTPPQANDIAVWTSGSYGHVAYVISATSSTRFEVVEANRGCPGCVRRMSYTVNDPGFAGFLRK